MNYSNSNISLEARLECRVFRTSLHDKQAVKNISLTLNQLPGIWDWSVDLDDRENVLRVEGAGLSAEVIIEALRREGVAIQELPV